MDCIALLRECPRRTGLDTFAAAGAILRLAPIIPEISDNARVDTARSDAARAENTAIVIEDEARMRHIHRQARVVIGVAHMCDAEGLRKRLKFAMAANPCESHIACGSFCSDDDDPSP
jgi:hypothetical protein